MKNKNERYVPLYSVGCFLDKTTGMTFAMLSSSDCFCKDNATHLTDCCDEWFDSLDKKDKEIVNNLIK